MVRKFPVMSAVLMHLSPRGFLFSVRFFLVGLLFMLFDLEISFLFP